MYNFYLIALLLTISTHSYAACNNSIIRTATDSRYQLLNNGTEIKDSQTGLIWQRCSLGQTWSGTNCSGTASTYNWTNALQTAKNMGSGWRLPNIKELGSLVEQACYSPSINEIYFPNTKSNYYWSSSPSHDNKSAWFVHFNEGFISYGDGRNDDPPKLNNYYVRLVRFDQ